MYSFRNGEAPCSGSRAFQGLSLIMCDKRVDDGLDIAIQNILQIIQSKTDTVVRDPTLGEIVCADALASVSGTDL